MTISNKMLLFRTLMILIPFTTVAVNHRNNELRRQYADFLRIFKKPEISSGFETFVQNLQTIEANNRERNVCKMFLTQHSDTFENEYILNTCTNIW